MIVARGNLDKLLKETQQLSYQWFRLMRKFERVGKALSKVQIDLREIKRLQEDLETLKLQVGIVSSTKEKKSE